MPVRAIDGVLSLSHPAQPQPLLTPRPPHRQQPPHQYHRYPFVLLSHSFLFSHPQASNISWGQTATNTVHQQLFRYSNLHPSHRASLPCPAPCYHPTEKLIARSTVCILTSLEIFSFIFPSQNLFGIRNHHQYIQTRIISSNMKHTRHRLQTPMPWPSK
jgi:hypothetical protein